MRFLKKEFRQKRPHDYRNSFGSRNQIIGSHPRQRVMYSSSRLSPNVDYLNQLLRKSYTTCQHKIRGGCNSSAYMTIRYLVIYKNTQLRKWQKWMIFMHSNFPSLSTAHVIKLAGKIVKIGEKTGKVMQMTFFSCAC